MLPDLFAKLEATLEEGCQTHIANGGTIIYGRFHDKGNGYDPIYASIDREESEKISAPDPCDRAHCQLNKKLGFKISVLDFLAFVNGMDNIKNSGGDKSVWALGQKFREKYIKEDIDGSEEIKSSVEGS